jgi:tRNA (adenine37-N6)-methyltransferase
MTTITLQPIGIIHTPFRVQAGTPIQPAYAAGAAGTVTVLDAYAEALADLAAMERIWLLYHFDRVHGWQGRVVPYRDDVPRGLFATRSPARPNPIGMSVVRLVSVDGPVLHVLDVDMLDGTPLLDIKPYVPRFDAHPVSRAGWLDTTTSTEQAADDRFEGPRTGPPAT